MGDHLEMEKTGGTAFQVTGRVCGAPCLSVPSSPKETCLLHPAAVDPARLPLSQKVAETVSHSGQGPLLPGLSGRVGFTPSLEIAAAGGSWEVLPLQLLLEGTSLRKLRINTLLLGTPSGSSDLPTVVSFC